MSVSDFLQLPPAVRTVFVVMLWPAIWAGAQLIVAFAGDLSRQATHQHRTYMTFNAANEEQRGGAHGDQQG